MKFNGMNGGLSFGTLISTLFLLGLAGASTFLDNSQANFDLGTYNFTFYNSSGFVQLNSSRLNGTFTSQIFNAGASHFNNISWTQGGYYQQEVLSNQSTENGLVAQFPFNNNYLETISNTSAVPDTPSTMQSLVQCKFGGCIKSTEADDSALLFTKANSSQNLSIGTYFLWLRVSENTTSEKYILTDGDAMSYPTTSMWLSIKSLQLGVLVSTVGASLTTATTGVFLEPERWYAIALTYNGSKTSLYRDGILAYSSNDATGNFVQHGKTLGIFNFRYYTGAVINASIDNFMIWNRSLSATEILDIYKRGALQLNLSVQSCDDASCSGESWTNLGSNLTSPQNLNVANNTYFQYKLDFLTDNVSYAPELYNVTIDYTLLDLTSPNISLNYPESGGNLSYANVYFNFTSTDETATTLNCSLYVDSVYKNNNASVINGTITSLNASSLSEGSHNWTINCSDTSGNSNSSSRSFYIDLTSPNITNLVYSPNSTDSVDPGGSIIVNATVSDSGVSVSSVILQYYNGTSWGNVTMTSNSATNYNATITLVSSEQNYTYNIWANDSLGNYGNSSNQTFSSAWDCGWTSNSELGEIAGYNQNKFIGNITINNTGDAAYSNNNCSLDFRLTYDLLEGRAYYDGEYVKNIKSYTLGAKTNQTISVNATFGTEIKSENLVITLEEYRLRSSTRYRNTTATIVSNRAGPYLYQKITISPSSVYLTAGNISMQGYLRNLMGSATENENNTAYNVSFYWTLPSGLTNVSGNLDINYTNLSDNNLNYIDTNLSFSSLASMTAGNALVTLNAKGYNLSGSLIEDADGNTLISSSVNISFICYNVSDGVYVTACGAADGDYVAPITTVTTPGGSSGGGGGGASSGGGGTATRADYQFVRGKQNEINVPFVNKNANVTMTGITFGLSGSLAKYIEVSPQSLSSLLPGEKIDVVLKVVSPGYLQLGQQKITLNIRGNLGLTVYSENREIVLQINDLSKEDASALLEDSKKLMVQLNSSGLSSSVLEQLLSDMDKAFLDLDYSKVKANYDLISTQVNEALGAKKTVEQLQSLILDSRERGIDVAGTERILKLVELSLSRGEFDQAFLRAQEALSSYALETKGELSSLMYYLKNDYQTISLSAVFLFVASFVTYRVTRLQLLKNKIKKLKEEEKILTELIKVVQGQTFKEKKMSMDEYYEAMEQYEKKLSVVIEQLISLENQRVHALRFTTEDNKLKIEKEKIIDLIKQLQFDYLKRGNVETKVYELKLASYTRRIGDIDQRLATLEAQKEMRKIRRFPFIGG